MFAIQLDQPRTRWVVFFLIVGFFAIANLPWRLDDSDQAKQAYASFEMVGQGHWFYQYTPNQRSATKPPLVGWISAGVFEVTRWWEGAWRVPSFAAAVILLWLIGRSATAAYGAAAGTLALGAFGLNMFSPRLATLVRTDMPLALATFLVGLQIWEKIRRGEEWNRRDRLLAAALLAPALWIKGPIVLAFILPGVVVYQILRRKHGGPSAWCGWWPWLVALAIFLAWTIGGIVRQPGFYEDVVLKEFAGRFSAAVHEPVPIWFYLLSLLHRFLPWNLLLIGLALAGWRELSGRRLEAATLWLVCWSLGGLALMSLIPSKRVDRIFPVIPPLCLLLGALVARLHTVAHGRAKLLRWLPVLLLCACLFTAGNVAWRIERSVRNNAAALVRFSSQVRRAAGEHAWRYAVVGRREEGLLLYLRRDRFLSPEEAIAQWQAGTLDALVVPAQPARDWRASLPDAQENLVAPKSALLPEYSLLIRAEEKPARQRDGGR